MELFPEEKYNDMLAEAPEHVRSMDKARSGAQICIMHTRLRRSTLRTCVVWKSSRENSVKLEVFRDPSFDDVSGKWTGFFFFFFFFKFNIIVSRGDPPHIAFHFLLSK